MKVVYADAHGTLTYKYLTFEDIKEEVMSKGSKIFYVREASHDVNIWGSFVYEIAPWNKDQSPF